MLMQWGTNMPFVLIFEDFGECLQGFCVFWLFLFVGYHRRLCGMFVFVLTGTNQQQVQINKKHNKNKTSQQQPQMQQPDTQTHHTQKHELNHTKKLGNKQFALYLKSQPRISTHIYNIEKYLSVYQPFYYNAFLSTIKGRDLDALEILLEQEYGKLIQGKSFLHKINNAMFSRAKCLQKIKRDLTKVQAVLNMFKKCYFRKANTYDNIYLEYTQNQGYTSVEIDQTIEHSIRMISNLFIDMSRLRDMTIYIIETVHRWRVGVEQYMDRCQSHSRVDFYVTQDRDAQDGGRSVRVYDVIQNDTDFIWSSRLSEYIWLQFKEDPLLIRNVLNVSERPTKQVLEKYFVEILFPNSEQVIDKTIKVIDMLNHVYKPTQKNLYEEEQKLIENYLGLQRKNNQQIGFEIDNHDDNARSFVILNMNNNSKVSGGVSRLKKSSSESKVTVKKQFREEIVHDHKKLQEGFQTQSPYSNKSANKQNTRGWVFGKQLKKPSSDKIRQIIKKHEIQMTYLKNHKGIIKPFNISNYPEKKSIALAYLSEKNNDPIKAKQDGWIYSEDQITRNRTSRIKEVSKNFASEGEENKFQSQIYLERDKLKNSRKMYQSLVKINTIIEEDPKQHENDQQTPKNKPQKQQQKKEKTEDLKNKFYLNKRQNLLKQKQKIDQQQEFSKTIDKKDAKNIKNSQVKDSQKSKEIKKDVKNQNQKTGRNLVQSGIKINSIFNTQNQNQLQQAEIQVQGEQTPLNFRQFFEVFRADTKEKPKNQSRVVNQLAKSNLKNEEVKQLGGSLSIRKIIDRRRTQSLKSLALLPYYSQKNKHKKKQKNNPNINKSKSITKTENSYQSYNKIDLTKLSTNIPNFTPLSIPSQYLNLRTKQITKDITTKYVIHLCNQLPVSSQSFTSYHTPAFKSKLIQVLEDSTINSLIFDIEGEKDGKIGQAVVVETLSSTLKMRYTIEFINVYKLEMLATAVCRIAEQLLSTSPCQQVVYKLVEDKADPVSIHFIALIDQSLKKQAEKFSYFNILQKSALGLTHQSLYQHICILQPKHRNLIKQKISQKFKFDWRKRVAGSNYRSLVFETKCVALTSNFKLRSENLNKAMVEIYRDQSLGILYVVLLQKIMTKYHLKQLKVASLSVNDVDQTTGLVKKSPYLRSIFYGLLELIKKTNQLTLNPKSPQLSSWLKNSITKFTNMTDLLNYLSYKQYDQTFKFDFLTQSRFILNHELTLSEVNLSTSLDFILENSTNMLLMNNHHNFVIEEITRVGGSGNKNQSFSEDGPLNGYLLPTTEDNLKLFFISAKQYLNCSDSLDLYSYLELLFRQSTLKQLPNIPQVVIPDLTKRKTKVNSVKMYDGFLRLFPQRQFYSASMMKVQNLWENFYPNAVISKPRSDAIVIDYPIIVGFFDCALGMPIVSYALKQEK